MRISVDKYVKQRTEIEIEIEGITLLSVEETKQVREMLAIGWWWWLRSPGDYSYYAALVDSGGVYDIGNIVNDNNVCVRPALKISNPKSANFEIGDRIDALGYTWTYVLDWIALCDSSIGYHRFDASSNDWEKSELKQWLEEWFAKRMEE